jgi:cell wall-associated NlpC family hydrolase
MKKMLIHFLFCVMLVLAATSCATAEPLAGAEDMPTDSQAIPTSEVNNEAWSDRAREVLVNALSLSGIRYKYGGNAPEVGFDCSGFVRYVFKQATSLTLPRTTLAMSQLGTTVPKNELQPGDLVFFNTLKSAFSHVGIYLGNNRFIHSPRSGGTVRIESLDTEYWAKHYNGAQRLNTEKQSVQ